MCGVIHSLYTAGHAPVGGRAAYDLDACAEAVRLAELLHDLLPDQPTPAADLALLLLTEARRPARLDEHGDVVTLDRQERGRWNVSAIDRGIAPPDEKSCLSYLLEARSFVSAVSQVQPKDARFTRRFLVITHGITIRDRLRTLSRYAWSESCVRL